MAEKTNNKNNSVNVSFPLPFYQAMCTPHRTRLALLMIAGIPLLSFVGCGGGGSAGSAASTSTDQFAASDTAVATESSSPSKVIKVPGSTTAEVALFPNGRAYYSPDGYNLGGGGSTIIAYSGGLQVADIEAAPAGIDTLFSDGSVHFSPDGQNLGGGGSTVSAYKGSARITMIVSVPGGVDAVTSNGSAYFSPDGLNLGGGGSSANIYGGNGTIEQIIPMEAGGVVTLLRGGTAYFSPNNQNIGGGGSTFLATTSTTKITTMVKVGSGVLTQFTNKQVYLSPDGQNLAGGGGTVQVASWNTSLANPSFAPRDSARGIEFNGKLWVSGGYADPTNSNSCFKTCSYFDLWSSVDAEGANWNAKASFATATTPNPRDASPTLNNGVQDVALPTDFYDPYSPLVVWNNQLVAVGSTVWSSASGNSWTQQTLSDGVTPAAGPVSPRAGENSRMVTLNGTLFFLEPDTGEVYSTVDPAAATWTDLGAIPGFTPRCGAAVYQIAGKIWVTGGGLCDYSQTFNDTWSSTDGITWTQSTVSAAWSARMWPCVTVSDDGVAWLVGGYAPTDWNNSNGTVTVRIGLNRADVWYTKDGESWKQLKADNGAALVDGTALEPRHAATCFASSASSQDFVLSVVGGTGGSNPNDADAQVLNSLRQLALPAAASLP